MDKLLFKVSKANPNIATAIPNRVDLLGILLNNKKEIIGTKITDKDVIKLELDAVVYIKPMV